MTADPLPPVVTLVQAWKARPEKLVDLARERRGPRLCRAALASLGATEERVALYVEVVGAEQALEPWEAHGDALELVATMAEIAVGEAQEWGRMTVDDVLAGWTVSVQHPSQPDGSAPMSYWGWKATRHWWAVAAAGIGAIELSRREVAIAFDDLDELARLRGIRMPPMAAGEVFEPPMQFFLEPVQQTFPLKGLRYMRPRKRRDSR